MTWVVRIAADGGQRDGRIETYEMIEDFAQLDQLVRGKHVYEIHLVRAEGRNAAQIIYEATQGRRPR